MSTTLRSTPATRAKAEFAALWRDVVGDHRPQMVCKYGEKEAMLLVRREDIVQLLDGHYIGSVLSIDEGEFVASIPAMGVIGAGATFDEAMDDLTTQLRAYAADFFERFAFYMQTDRKVHAPALLRFAATTESRQRALLVSDSQRASEAKRAVGAHHVEGQRAIELA